MEIKPLAADPTLITTVAGWLFNEWGHHNPGSSHQRAIQRLSERVGSTTIPITLVAFEADQSVGTASLVASDMESRPQLTPWLASVYVMPEFRSRGIGSALCQAIASELKRLKFQEAYLFTPNKESLYRSLGWKTIENTSYRDESVVVMKYNLSL